MVGNMPDAYKEGFLHATEKRFQNQDFDELKGKEIEKTQEQMRIIADVNIATNEILRRYGLIDFDIPASNVHIIADEKWVKGSSNGFFNADLQAVAIREQPMNLAFMKILFHELIHFKSYGAWQVNEENGNRDVRKYRTGLSINSRDREGRAFFTALNEAVTEELTKRNARSLLRKPEFTKEVTETERIITTDRQRSRKSNGELLISEDTFCARQTSTKEWSNALWRYFGTRVGLKDEILETVVTNFSYPVERKALKRLVSRLYQENQDSYDSEDAVFEIFAKAMMTGNILTLGKAIDSTFGVGTFRRIGELGNNGKDFLEYVETL